MGLVSIFKKNKAPLKKNQPVNANWRGDISTGLL